MEQKPNLYSEYKLLNHFNRLVNWERGGISYPISVDFDISNKCNNRCPSCNGSRNKDSTVVSLDDAKKTLFQLKEAGINAIVLGGGGEPSCNPNLEKILGLIKENYMESAIYTNGYELSPGVINSIVNYCTWARISLDADSPKIYKRTHGMGDKPFFQVLENISKLVDARKKNNSKIIMGTGYLIGPHSIEGVYNATRISKELGADYIRFRPFFNLRGNRNFTAEKGKEMINELNRCKKFEDSSFSVTYPVNRCEYETKTGDKNRSYTTCYFPDFFASITADLKVYPCCALKGNEKYCLGDLKKSSFKEIWVSKERKEVLDNITFKDCPNPCQFEKNIELLSAIKSQINHSNFL